MRARILLATALLFPLLAPAPGLAQQGVTASVSGQAGGVADTDEDVQVAGPVEASLDIGTLESAVIGTAEASQGILHSFANARLEYAGGPAPVTLVDSLSEFRDLIVITSPDLSNGNQAFVRYRVILEGTAFASGNMPPAFPALSGYMLSVGYFGTLSSSQIYDDLFGGAPSMVDLDFTDTAPIVLGETLQFQVQLIASALVNSPLTAGTYEAEMDLGSTFRWGGIPEVTDMMGEPIAFHIESDSGLDWTQEVVPEPGSGLLGVMAVTVTLALRRSTWRDARADRST